MTENLEGTPVEAPVTPEVASAQPEGQPDWNKLLPQDWADIVEKAPPDALRKHPKVAGVLGSELQKRLAKETERLAKQHDEALSKARAEWEAEQREPARSEYAKRLGAALGQTREWQEATPEERTEFAKKLLNLDDDAALPAFLSTAVEFLTEKRKAAEIAAFKQKELKAAREAIRQELAAQFMRAMPAPDIARPKGRPSGVDIRGMSDEEFDEYYKKHVLK